MAPQITGLIGVDINPAVMRYNHFNKLLLLLSDDLETYRHLRGVDIFEQETSTEGKEDRAKKVAARKKKVQDLLDSQPRDKRMNFYRENFAAFADEFYAAQDSSEMRDRMYSAKSKQSYDGSKGSALAQSTSAMFPIT